MDLEEYLRQRRERRQNAYVDFGSSVEFADLTPDLQYALEDQGEAEFSIEGGRTSRWNVMDMMFQRASPFSVRNTLADIRNEGREGQASDFTGAFRGLASNASLNEEREAYTPTDEEVFAVAQKYGLDENSYDHLVNWSAGPEDLDNVALAIASQRTRDALIAESVGPVDGFLMDAAANIVRPEFLALGGVAGKTFQVGMTTNRLMNAGRGALAAGMADTPLEALRAQDNPNYTVGDAAFTVGASMLLGAGLGALPSSLLKPEDIIDAQLLEENLRRMTRAEDIFLPRADASGSVGAGGLNTLARDPLSPDQFAPDAPEQMWWGLGFTPMSTLWGSSNAATRELARDLIWNPGAATQGENMIEIATRLRDSGAAFLTPADDAMRQYFRELDDLGSKATSYEEAVQPISTVTGGVTDRQSDEFYEIVGQVIAGVRTTDNPHILRAAESLRDGIEDSLYMMQDSNYAGWRTWQGIENATGRSIPEAVDVIADRSYLPRRASQDGWRKVEKDFIRDDHTRFTNDELLARSHNRIADRLTEVYLRSDANREWAQQLAERANQFRKGTPNATGAIAAPLQAEEMAKRIMRNYVRTWSNIAEREIADAVSGVPSRPMSVADRENVKEIIQEMFDGDGIDPGLREEIAETVLNLVAPAKRRTTADNPRLMDRIELPLNAELDGDIMPMFDWNASSLFNDYRAGAAGRAALLRRGYDGPGDFKARADRILTDAKGTGQANIDRALKEHSFLMDGLGSVLTERQYMRNNGPIRNGAKFWTQAVARLNIAAFLNNTALGPMFAEYGAVFFRAGHRLFTKIPAYNRYMQAARRGDLEGMKGGFMIADVMAGHGSALTRQRGTGRNRFDFDGPEEVGKGRIRGAVDELSRKAANATGRLSGMVPASDFLRSLHMVEDLTKLAEGDFWTPFQRSQAGLTEDMANRVRVLMRGAPFTEGVGSGQRIIDDRALMLKAAKEDPEAWNALIGALNRRARQRVQDPDWGHAPTWTRFPGLDLLFQLFSYPMNAVNKQLVPFGRAVWERDPDAFRTLFSAFTAAIGYSVRVVAQSAASDEPEEYLKRRLTTAEIAKAMVYYSTVASIAPNVLDAGLELTGNDPLFSQTRASGLAANPYMANPTWTRLQNIVGKTNRIFRGDDIEKNAEDLAGLLVPTGNWIPTQILINTLFEPLPGDDDDE